MIVIVRRLRRLAGIAALMCVSSGMAAAATLPSGFSETLIASGLRQPTAMAFAADGRLFVCEQGGTLRVIKNGVLLSTPFVSLTNRVSRFTATGDVAQAGSETIPMDLEPLGATNHNGGAIHFGVDGKLYIAVGENAQIKPLRTWHDRRAESPQHGAS